MKQIDLAVNGTLMRGFGLNSNLIAVGAIFVKEINTAPEYRLWSVEDQYPAMQRDTQHGKSIAVEIWSITPEGLVTILNQEPSGLVVGKITLEDNAAVLGVLGEAWICENKPEITAYGGWRAYVESSRGKKD
jgi:gamma-glutamylcyclotransferase (GGCT)/AIG2-like uncharacterized protein YtfP